MRKHTLALLIVFTLLILSWPAYAADTILVNVDGKNIASDVPPKIVNGTTLVPIRTTSEALGASINWEPNTQKITGEKGDKSFILTLNSPVAIINGKNTTLTVPPAMVKNRVLVPLRIVAESFGAGVQWVPEKNTITITSRIVQPNDTGTVILTTTSKTGLYYDGGSLEELKMPNKEIKNWHIAPDKTVFASVMDNTNGAITLCMFANGGLIPLIYNFDMEGYIEYNNSILLYGVDTLSKRNALYLFDDHKTRLLQNDFLIGSYTTYQGDLIINKYSINRQYATVVISPGEWRPKTIDEGLIINEFIENNGRLFLNCTKDSGTDKPLAEIYKDDNEYKLAVIDKNAELSFEDTAYFKGELYYIKDNSRLMKASRTGATEVFFKDAIHDGTKNYRYHVTKLIAFNDRMYINVKAQYDVIDSPRVPKNRDKQLLEVLLEDNRTTYTTEIIHSNIEAKNVYLTKNALVILGASSQDKILQVHNEKRYFTQTNDILKIHDIFEAGNRLFIYVDEQNRLEDKRQKSLLLYEANRVRNLYPDADIKNMTVQGSSLIMNVYESDVKLYKVFSFINLFTEQITDLNVKYWNEAGDTLFLEGRGADNEHILASFKDLKKTIIVKGLEVKNIIQAKGDYFLIYAIDRNKDSTRDVRNKYNLYLYQQAENTIQLIAKDTRIQDMFYVE